MRNDNVNMHIILGNKILLGTVRWDYTYIKFYNFVMLKIGKARLFIIK